jgi:predicted alpha-1,2-mannosidase
MPGVYGLRMAHFYFLRPLLAVLVGLTLALAGPPGAAQPAEDVFVCGINGSRPGDPDAGKPRFGRYVNPFIGTDGTGHTFPGPSHPFGMAQPGPDNADRGWSFASGYQFRAPKIIGFSNTRASGIGIPELGDVLLMPSQTWRVDLSSTKADEAAEIGEYSVRLPDNGVRVRLFAARRSALHHYQFDKGGSAFVLVDLNHGLMFLDTPRVTSHAIRLTPDGVEGVLTARNWTTRTVAFSVAFDAPIAEAKLLPARPGDSAPRYMFRFENLPNRVVNAAIGVSTTDAAGARANRAEVADWDELRIKNETVAAWENLLQRVEISAPRDQKVILYTALYHAFLHPSEISDVDGRYRGPDGVIRQARGRVHYSTLSLWDSFRAAHPLYTLLTPERVDDFILTLVDHADAVGRLPRWPIWGGETNTMIGEPALPVIADAYAKGFRGFDAARALAAMINTSTQDEGLSQWSLYERFGYYPFDQVKDEAVSRTLEAGIGDDAVARMARLMGAPATAARFQRRALNWKNLMDPETRLARGRDAKGQWRTPFDPLKPTSPLNNPGDYTEANAWQYSFTPALFDPEGLIAAMGAKAGFTDMLDTFFFSLPATEGAKYLGQEAMIGQYAHGNEPSHHIAWLYAYTDAPWRGQRLVRRIAADFYNATPDGIIGNEDAGQLSAWYVFATLGFYPVQPASAAYVLGAPLASEIVVRVPGRPPLTISAPGVRAAPSQNYAHAHAWNGRRMTRTISHKDLIAGGVLRVQMRAMPHDRVWRD